MKKQKGFTLLEMIISIGIFVLVVTASSVVFNQALRAYSYTTSRMAAAREAGLAMDRIMQDIRPDTTTGTKPILEGIAPRISDNTQIALTLPAPEGDVRYHRVADPLNPGFFTIQRQRIYAAGQPNDLLARNVITLRFDYYDNANQALNPALPGLGANTETVEVTIETQVNNQIFRLYNVANR